MFSATVFYPLFLFCVFFYATESNAISDTIVTEMMLILQQYPKLYIFPLKPLRKLNIRFVGKQIVYVEYISDGTALCFCVQFTYTRLILVTQIKK